MLRRQALVYLVGASIQKLIPFLLLPLYTRLMPIEEFGNYASFIAFLAMFSLLVGLKPDSYLLSSYSRDGIAEFNEKVTICVILIPISLVVSFPLILLLAPFFFQHIDYLTLILLVLFSSLLLAFIQICSVLLQIQERAIYLVSLQTLSILVANGIGVTLLYWNDTWSSRVFGDLVGSILLAFLLLKVIKPHLKLVEFANLKNALTSALTFLLPVFVHVVSFTFLNVGDRLIIQSLLGADAVAKYSVAYMFGMIVGVFHDSFLKAWNPYFYSKVIKSLKDERDVNRHARIYSLFSIILGVMVGGFFSVVYRLVLPTEYHGVEYIIIIVSLAYSLEGIRKVYSGYLFLQNKTRIIAKIALASVLMNVLLNYILIRLIDLDGAAIATLIAFLNMMIFTVYYSRKSRLEFQSTLE
ncbi:oligosaccharide flippase family protein [Aliikangiella maris]|uniref:Oligosaccharide flippase family protein n=2 Tax=Aliikangiella maris TaxID=3162458 RepID=A0ABV3MMI7_9GAMM